MIESHHASMRPRPIDVVQLLSLFESRLGSRPNPSHDDEPVDVTLLRMRCVTAKCASAPCFTLLLRRQLLLHDKGHVKRVDQGHVCPPDPRNSGSPQTAIRPKRNKGMRAPRVPRVQLSTVEYGCLCECGTEPSKAAVVHAAPIPRRPAM